MILAFDNISSFAASSEEILLELAKKNENITTLTADFVMEKFVSILDDKVKSKGKFKFKVPNKFRWETLKPDKCIIISDGSTIKIHYPDMNQMDEYPISNYGWITEIFRDFPMSKEFDVAKLENKYKITLLQNEKNDKYFKFKLEPQTSDSSGTYKFLELSIDQKDYLVKKIAFHEFSGDRIEIEFDNISQNKDISDDTFSEIGNKGVRK
jgi:chaperone LolA